MKTIAIIEGFAGGHMLSRHFRKAAKTAGYSVVKNASKADYIIAHSAGCFLVPSNNNAKKIVLIGPPYWPGKSLLMRSARKLKSEHGDLKSRINRRYILKKKALETYYIFRRPKATLILRGNHGSLNFLDKLDKSKVIMVRNLDDEYSGPMLKNDIDKSILGYLELPGQHDDYYTNPEPYLKILEQ